MKKHLWLLILLLPLAGCSGNYESSAKIDSSSLFTGLNENMMAVGYLDREFRKVNAFNDVEAKALLKAESGILGEFEYLQNITEINCSVPYFEFIASYNRIMPNIKTLYSILDEHIIVYPEHVQIIYAMAKKDISASIRNVETSKQDKAADISGANKKAFVGNLYSLYNSVKPLLSGL